MNISPFKTYQTCLPNRTYIVFSFSIINSYGKLWETYFQNDSVFVKQACTKLR